MSIFKKHFSDKSEDAERVKSEQSFNTEEMLHTGSGVGLAAYQGGKSDFSFTDGKNQIDFSGKVIESSYEFFVGAESVYENGELLYDRDAICVDNYHNETYTRGKFDSMSDVVAYLGEKYPDTAWQSTSNPYPKVDKVYDYRWENKAYAAELEAKKNHTYLDRVVFATNSIQEAIAYYHLFKDKSGLKVTALFDTNTNENSAFVIEKENALAEIVDDYNKLFDTNYNRDDDPQLKLFKRDVTSRLSHKGVYKHISDDDMIDIVIVVDQLLTGFDSKYVNTLYLDKVLESDALIQAISRTNRVLDFNEKPWGIFKYYRKPYTMKQNIEDALRLYCEGGSTNGVIVNNIDDNIIIANDYYRTIKDIFDIHHIKNFEKLPSLQADCQKFKSLFLSLKQLIHGMCLQGMNWNDDNDEYVLKLKVAGKWIDSHYRIFDILYKRYLESVSSREQSDFNGVAGYNVPAYVSEIGNEKIDADYLESHFKIVVPKLVNHVDDDVVKSFESQLGALSEMHQKYAKQIIDDIRSGKLDVCDRSLYELIALYESTEEIQQISDFSDEYGLDYDKLQGIYHKSGNIDLQVNDLLDTCDWHKACSALGVAGRFNARPLLNKLIREFVR